MESGTVCAIIALVTFALGALAGAAIATMVVSNKNNEL
jgi:hypothetical protein